jgi:hypothetical protein
MATGFSTAHNSLLSSGAKATGFVLYPPKAAGHAVSPATHTQSSVVANCPQKRRTRGISARAHSFSHAPTPPQQQWQQQQKQQQQQQQSTPAFWEEEEKRGRGEVTGSYEKKEWSASEFTGVELFCNLLCILPLQNPEGTHIFLRSVFAVMSDLVSWLSPIHTILLWHVYRVCA